MNLLDRVARWPSMAISAGLAVVFAGVLAREVYDVAGYHDNWPFDLAVGLVVCAAALLRGRDRAAMAAVALVVAGAAELAAWLWQLPAQPDGAAALGLLVLLGSAIRVLPVRPAVGIAVATLVLAVTSYGLHSQSFEAALHVLGQGWGVAIAVGLGLRFHDARHRTTIELVRRDERLQLARELHDEAAHHITGIVIQAQAARIAAQKHPELLAASLDDIESVAADALASMRRVIGVLRDADDGGGVTPGAGQLTELVDRFAGCGPDVRLCLPDGAAELAWPTEVTSSVYRVVQEALTNITRHAPGARSATVTLAQGQEVITVEITDDAPAGASPRFPYTSGYGLVGMRERVEALGGTFHAGPGPRAGWSVLATLPAAGRP